MADTAAPTRPNGSWIHTRSGPSSRRPRRAVGTPRASRVAPAPGRGTTTRARAEGPGTSQPRHGTGSGGAGASGFNDQRLSGHSIPTGARDRPATAATVTSRSARPPTGTTPGRTRACTARPATAWRARVQASTGARASAAPSAAARGRVPGDPAAQAATTRATATARAAAPRPVSRSASRRPVTVARPRGAPRGARPPSPPPRPPPRRRRRPRPRCPGAATGGGPGWVRRTPARPRG